MAKLLYHFKTVIMYAYIYIYIRISLQACLQDLPFKAPVKVQLKKKSHMASCLRVLALMS